MKNLAVVLVTIGMGLIPWTVAKAATTDLGVNFSTTQSLWGGGPAAGFSRSGSFGGGTGIVYSAAANSGTVSASHGGTIRADYTDQIQPNLGAIIDLQHLGSSAGGSLNSAFGAGVQVDGRLKFCAIPTPFGCGLNVNETFGLIDTGFLLQPGTSFDSTLGTTGSANAVDNAVGFGPSLNLGIGTLGAQVNVDLAQSISLKPTGIDGALAYTHRGTGTSGMIPFSLGTGSVEQIITEALAVGIWDFSLVDLDLRNLFRNDIDLDLRPSIDYVLGEWPSPGSPLFSVGLLDESFELNFGLSTIVDAFSIVVIPEPSAALMLGLGLASLAGGARRVRRPGPVRT